MRCDIPESVILAKTHTGRQWIPQTAVEDLRSRDVSSYSPRASRRSGLLNSLRGCPDACRSRWGQAENRQATLFADPEHLRIGHLPGNIEDPIRTPKLDRVDCERNGVVMEHLVICPMAGSGVVVDMKLGWRVEECEPE